MNNIAIPTTMGIKKKAMPISRPIRKVGNIFHPVWCAWKPQKID